ncbi:hypothetical protein E1193_13450 [Micromonospora sp. KC606]|uniref:hypothetical protein n=1 Tax=Micromonospora sp. KC606 TaxID=2530379 RepID=UPI00104ABDF3|nr:hypothetical protein [Micromonospora sp. KC606]TDC81903.1 hypothetical protein E1193_13450 [Micromonospora sp. KC606]
MAYATEAELTAYPVTVPAGASAALLLTRASRDVDRALLCATYDAADADVIAALRDATIEQVAGMIAAGDLTGTGATQPTSGFTIGKVSVQRGGGSGGSSQQAEKINGLWPQAWLVLQTAGLTGQGPQETWYGLV